MSDAPAKKRARFQLHLSTCVVLMFVAGALGWANLVRSSWKFRDFYHGWVHMESLGWPFWFHSNVNGLEYEPEMWRPEWLAADIAIAVALFVLIAYACEWAFRRSALRAPNAEK